MAVEARRLIRGAGCGPQPRVSSGQMTERGLPIADGAPACPFVAFEDERDERAATPDPRHRCYAETRPAPRALAHQEAYCLSSSFPVCPTFQDWARREAARSRADSPRPVESGGEDAVSRRNPPRTWSAPPPWLGGRRGGPAAGDWVDDDPHLDPNESIQAAQPTPGGGLSGSYADRAISDPRAAAADDMDADQPEDGRAAELPLAGGAFPAADQPPGANRPEAPAPTPANRAPEIWDEEPAAGSAEAAAHRPRRERDPGRVAAFTGDAAGEPQPPGPGRRPERHRESDAPEWERAKPMEAYPTLRSRRLPELSVSPILLAVVALALAAAFVFALPGLLGFGNPQTAGSPGATTPIRTALPSFAPTPVPQPTQHIYIVQANDTMSRIAGRFKIPLAELIAANAANIPNPNTLQIGDQVIIPVPLPSQVPAASPASSP